MNKKVVFLPYDFDSALGINNEGQLAFSYNLEDIDMVNATTGVYNGYDSVLWKNVRATFFDEIRTMYQELRSSGKLSYDKVEKMFEDHQSKWPIALVNEDSRFTYTDPLVAPEDGKDPTNSYLTMLQGLKTEQRKYWMYNRFRYEDSKYNAGDALTDVITIRSNAKADITVTPYADIYAAILYGSKFSKERATRNEPKLIKCLADTLNDTETYIYSASQLRSIGDLSPCMVGWADFSAGVRLQDLKLGDSSVSYQNEDLLDLFLGNNVLLKVIDCRNCVNLGGAAMVRGERKLSTTPTIDMSGCLGIEEAYFENTSIKGVTFPNGGVLRIVHLPAGITNLTLRNQTKITDLTIPSYATITTLWLENCSPAVDPIYILNQIQDNSRVRLANFTISVSTKSEIDSFYAKLDKMRGLDEYGNNLEKAAAIGVINIPALDGSDAAVYKERYPYITIKAGALRCVLTYKTFDGSTTIDSEIIATTDGDIGDGTKVNSTPRDADVQWTYTPNGWSRTPNGDPDPTALIDVDADRIVYAAYDKTIRAYTVIWKNADGTILKTETLNYGDTPVWTGAVPSYNGELARGWDKPLDPITGDTIFTAKYPTKYNVNFYNGSTLLDSKTVEEGGAVEYSGSTPVNSTDNTRPFLGWNTDSTATEADPNALMNVTADRNLYAIFRAKYTVSFYNGTSLITSTSVLSGEDATYTGSTPVNAQDNTRTFIGWNTDSTATTADADALKNVTANRSVYAIYKIQYDVRFYNGATLLSTKAVEEGRDATYTGTTPVSSRNEADIFLGWNTDYTATTASATALTNIIAPRDVYAIFKNAYYVKFFNGSSLVETDVVEEGGNTTFNGATPTDPDNLGRVFLGWSTDASATAADENALNNVLANRNVYAIYTPSYQVRFYNGSTLLETKRVPEGGNVTYTGTTPVNSTDGTLAFLGWNTDSTATEADTNALTNVTANRDLYAIFASAIDDTEIADDWATILANIDNGTYKTKYKIGNYKPLDLGTEGTINMQIVAFDADDKADGSGKAKVTVIAKDLLNTKHTMNTTATTEGGWAASAMRSYLATDIAPKIPSAVSSRIVQVNKTYKDYTNGEQTSVDSLWIPSEHETNNGATGYETTGPAYSVFTDNASRIKTINGTAGIWWLRSASNATSFRRVVNNGYRSSYSADNSFGVALGFSLD